MWFLALPLTAALLVLAGTASAGGTGFNLSYSTQTNALILPSVDLVAVSTSYTSGPNLTASLTLAGTPVTNAPGYTYYWLFDGAGTGNSTAWAFVDRGGADLHSSNLPFGLPEAINYTVSGSTISISVATSLIGSSSGFTFDGVAFNGSSGNPDTYSYLGTDYAGNATCPGPSCTQGNNGNSPSGGTGTSGIPPGEIIWPVVIAVILVIIAVVLVRKRRAKPAVAAPPSPTGTTSGGTPPPPPQ